MDLLDVQSAYQKLVKLRSVVLHHVNPVIIMIMMMMMMMRINITIINSMVTKRSPVTNWRL